jgi:hypothetical protein
MDDDALKTIKRRINAAENPKRHILTHHEISNSTPATVPTAIKKSHTPQEKSDNVADLLKS